MSGTHPRRRWVRQWGAIVGVFIGVTVALLDDGDDHSPTADAPAPTTITTTTTTSDTTTTNRRLPIPVHTTIGGGQLEYLVPWAWDPIDVYVMDVPEQYAEYSYLLSAAQDPDAGCAVRPPTAGAYLDTSSGPSAKQAVEHAKGLATIAFDGEGGEPTITVATSRAMTRPGWTGREVVVHATLATPLACGMTKGTVALLAVTTKADPDRTVMIAAFAGTDGPDGTSAATLRTIVNSVRLADD